MLVNYFHVHDIIHVKRSLIFGPVVSTVSVILATTQLLSVTLQSITSDWSRSILPTFDVYVSAFYIIESFYKFYVFGFFWVRGLWDMFDSLSCAAMAFDAVEITVYSRPVRNLNLRCVAIVRSVRILHACLRYNIPREPSVLYHRMFTSFAGMTSSLVYATVFYALLSLVGSLLVCADVLPSLTELRLPAHQAWAEARPLFGSVPQGLFSMIEIIFLDDWFSSFCRPLINGGKWFSAFIVLFVVLAGSIAFTSLLFGCVVDKAVAVSVDIARNEESTNSLEQESFFNHFLGELETAIAPAMRENKLMLRVGQIEAMGKEGARIYATMQKAGVTSEDVGHAVKLIDVNGVGEVEFRMFKASLPRIRKEAQGQDIVYINVQIQNGLERACFICDDLEGLTMKTRNARSKLHSVAAIIEQRRLARVSRAQAHESDRAIAGRRHELAKSFKNLFTPTRIP
jgi:hypothetical protein